MNVPPLPPFCPDPSTLRWTLTAHDRERSVSDWSSQVEGKANWSASDLVRRPSMQRMIERAAQSVEYMVWSIFFTAVFRPSAWWPVSQWSHRTCALHSEFLNGSLRQHRLGEKCWKNAPTHWVQIVQASSWSPALISLWVATLESHRSDKGIFDFFDVSLGHLD